MEAVKEERLIGTGMIGIQDMIRSGNVSKKDVEAYMKKIATICENDSQEKSH